MIKIRNHIIKNHFHYLRTLSNIPIKQNVIPNTVFYYATAIDIDSLTNYLLYRYRTDQKNKVFDGFVKSSIRPFMDSSSKAKHITKLTELELKELVQKLISKNKDNVLDQLLLESEKFGRFLGELTLISLFEYYSQLGNTVKVKKLQKYCLDMCPNLYNRNGCYKHYLGRAQCFKGNSDKGLAIIIECYKEMNKLRSVYRVILRELIQDTIMNRSEASIVIFKKYVLELSEAWNDHYPLICFWHICWSSNWFSDHVLADELLENCERLRDIVKNRAEIFCITILRDYHHEDAVVRLLQIFLKFKLMNEYAKVLRVLFNFKLRNRDHRGCAEIIKNCEVLGISLPISQQGKYIKMLIQGQPNFETKQPCKPSFKNFKLKF